MISLKFKELFFDDAAVIAKIGKRTAATLSKLGAYIRRSAKSSIRKRRRPSLPGEPPSSHVGTLRNLIFFTYEEDKRDVVVGPVPIENNTNAPQVLEEGGTAKIASRLRTRVLGGAGEIAIGGKKKWKSARRVILPGGKEELVVFVKLRTEAQVRRANRLNQQLFGSQKPEIHVEKRPYMVPAEEAELRNIPQVFESTPL